MNRFIFILVLFMASTSLFSQEYEIAWEKDIGGSYAQFSKDGEFIYVAKGSLIHKYRSIDGSFVSTFDNSGVPKATEIYGMSISKNDKYLITWLGDTPGNHNLYDLATGKAIKQLSGFYWSDFLSDDDKLICIKDYEKCNIVSIIDVNSGKEIKSITSNNRQEIIKVSHNGKMFATATKSGPKNYLTLWNTETLTEIKRFELSGNAGTSFYEIKFSWDDKFVGVNLYPPYNIFIFDIINLKLYLNPKSINENLDFGFGFTSTNQFIFNYNDYTNMDYNLYFVDQNTLKINQLVHTITSNITTSSNGLIFTKYSILRPKSTDVREPIQANFFISYIKDLILIENKSEITENTDIKLFDFQGKEIFRNTIFLNIGVNKIQVPKVVQSGTYLIQLNSKSLNLNQKILIQR